jgi:hypothetical protein
LAFVATSRLDSLPQELTRQPEDIVLLEKIDHVFTVLASLSVEPDLRKAQNANFSIGKRLCSLIKERVGKGDGPAKQWMDVFHRLGSPLHVSVVWGNVFSDLPRE